MYILQKVPSRSWRISWMPKAAAATVKSREVSWELTLSATHEDTVNSKGRLMLSAGIV